MRPRLLAAAALLALLPRRAAAQTLSGGTFEMPQHGIAPVVQQVNQQVAGSTFAFTLGTRPYFANYPLLDMGGVQVYRTPGGPLHYLHVIDNPIQFGPLVNVSILQNSLPQDFDFFVDDPMTAPLRADPALILQANSRLTQNGGALLAPAPGTVVEFNVFSEDGSYYTANLDHLASIGIAYPDRNNDGIVDGTNPPMRASTLNLYALDQTHGLWVRMPDSSVDAARHVVTASVPQFTVYALIGTADERVDDVYAYPVPWAPNSGDAAKGTISGGITFTNLPSDGTISVYTMSGKLVWSTPVPTINGVLSKFQWDGRTPGGHNVVSGVYLWRIESGSNSKVGKLIIIR
jgi:hypothetical protein